MCNTQSVREIEAIMRRPYRRVISGEPVEGYLAEVLDLRGCMTAGETPEEALRNLKDATSLWIESALVHGDAIPEPQPRLITRSDPLSAKTNSLPPPAGGQRPAVCQSL